MTVALTAATDDSPDHSDREARLIVEHMPGFAWSAGQEGKLRYVTPPVALGLFGPLGSTLMLAPMVVAMLTVHRGKGFFAATSGIEVPFLYAAGAVVLAFTGAGSFSLDALLGLAGLASPALGAVAAGLLGGLGALALRRPVAQTAQAHS